MAATDDDTVPCEQCGAAMDRVPLPTTSGEDAGGTRYICPRCGHEVR